MKIFLFAILASASTFTSLASAECVVTTRVVLSKNLSDTTDCIPVALTCVASYGQRGQEAAASYQEVYKVKTITYHHDTCNGNTLLREVKNTETEYSQPIIAKSSRNYCSTGPIYPSEARNAVQVCDGSRKKFLGSNYSNGY